MMSVTKTEATPVAVMCKDCEWSGHITEILAENLIGLSLGDCSINGLGEFVCPKCSGLVRRTIH
ncbi:hypothetical protein LCGC14_1953190 [marine sediment metagenome]|uniref:Uncharacterized protein n=1 Tax=marine sediment metagenome TaxID=412755 RepID=A0A0F9FGR3_9ZZZZ